MTSPTQPTDKNVPSDAEIDAVFDAMPNGAHGFLEDWGYRQFARALLAQYGSRAGDVVVTRDEAGRIVAVTRQDKDGQILSVIAESAQHYRNGTIQMTIKADAQRAKED